MYVIIVCLHLILVVTKWTRIQCT